MPCENMHGHKDSGTCGEVKETQAVNIGRMISNRSVLDRLVVRDEILTVWGMRNV